MGFERQPGAERSLGRAARRGGNAIGMVEARKRLARKPNGRAKDDICTTMYVYNDITQSGRRGREGTANLPYLGRLKPIPISSTSWITGNRADVGVRCPQT